MFVDNPNHKGNVAELAIAKEAASLGLSVLMPITEHERYDLIIGIKGRLLRVQCKWASCQGDVVYVRLKSSYHSPDAGAMFVATYDAGEIDAVAVYCGGEGTNAFFCQVNSSMVGRWSSLRTRVGPKQPARRVKLGGRL